MSRVLSSWKDNIYPSLESFAASNWFSFRISLNLASSIFLSTLTSFSAPAVEKPPHSMMLPPSCITVGNGVFLVMCIAGFRPHGVLQIDQKVTFCSYLTRAPSSTCLLCSLHDLWQVKLSKMSGFLSTIA
ncbi:hypothetical protein CHARACLAT_009619 [Characodon lateralis]|uniref:Uncharacterized protein n=1 Tax=Characodon lateralis TaxID=208331 RepID=A0ABU7CQ13_9TELE|nr:hypothetical protein [Characodon lateralis]